MLVSSQAFPSRSVLVRINDVTRKRVSMFALKWKSFLIQLLNVLVLILPKFLSAKVDSSCLPLIVRKTCWSKHRVHEKLALTNFDSHRKCSQSWTTIFDIRIKDVGLLLTLALTQL